MPEVASYLPLPIDPAARVAVPFVSPQPDSTGQIPATPAGGQALPDDAPALLCRYPSKLEHMRVMGLIRRRDELDRMLDDDAKGTKPLDDEAVDKVRRELDDITGKILDVYVRGWKNMPKEAGEFDPAKPGESVMGIVTNLDADLLAVSIIPAAMQMGVSFRKKSVSPSGSSPAATASAAVTSTAAVSA